MFGNNFNGAQIYALPRHALTSGTSQVPVVQLSNIGLDIGSRRTASFTIIPASAPDGVFAAANGGTEYLLSSTAAEEANNPYGRSNVIGFWRLTSTQSLNTSSPFLGLSQKAVTTELYGVPPVSEQKAGPTPLRDCEVVACDYSAGVGSPNEVEGGLDSSDSRLFNTWFDGNRVWGSLSTIVEVRGRIKAGSAWFSFNRSGSVAAQGYVAVAGNNVIYPGIATLANGKGVIGVNLVGGDYYPSQAYMFSSTGTGRRAGCTSPGGHRSRGRVLRVRRGELRGADGPRGRLPRRRRPGTRSGSRTSTSRSPAPSSGT